MQRHVTDVRSKNNASVDHPLLVTGAVVLTPPVDGLLRNLEANADHARALLQHFKALLECT
ncbi:hypothetical protein CU043_02780 [Corynebacterium striatum]|nr:hypothetical protein [Corynebacterium striatum]